MALTKTQIISLLFSEAAQLAHGAGRMEADASQNAEDGYSNACTRLYARSRGAYAGARRMATLALDAAGEEGSRRSLFFKAEEFVDNFGTYQGEDKPKVLKGEDAPWPQRG